MSLGRSKRRGVTLPCFFLMEPLLHSGLVGRLRGGQGVAEDRRQALQDQQEGAKETGGGPASAGRQPI